MSHIAELKRIAEFPQSKICFEFAQLVCADKFNEAYLMLSNELMAKVTPEHLRESYVNMIHYIPEEERIVDDPNFILPTDVNLCIQNTLDDYMNKKENDIGWAYCSINGDEFSEAVSVIVEKNTAGKLVIREIEWGRP